MQAPGDAVLFPGTGRQHPAMRDLVAEYAPDLSVIVCDLLGEDPFARVADGMRFAQPAIFLTSIASWRTLTVSSAELVGLAGHSLGEFAALVAAGALDPGEAARLVVRRAILAEEVTRETGGGMIALLGVGRRRAVRFAARCGVYVANENCPGEVVLSGAEPEISAAARTAEELEINYRRLAVDGPFHSPLMKPAARRFAEALDGVKFAPPRLPILSSILAAPFRDPRRQLSDALIRRVRWHQTTKALNAMGARRFLEVSPGDVLTGLVRRSLRRERPKLEAMDWRDE